MKTLSLLAGASMAAFIASAAYADPAPTAATPPAKPVNAATPAPTAVPVAPATPAQPASPAPAVTPAAPVAASAAAPVVAQGDLVDTLTASGRFTTFVKALKAANLVGVIKSHPQMTVFAPTDAAFASLPPGKLDALMKNPAELQKLLAYHLVNTTVDSTKIKGSKGPVKTVLNTEIELDGSGSSLMVNAATITQADVKTEGGGTIQVIDKVLDPSAPAMPEPAPAPTAAPEPATAQPAAQPEPASPDPTPKG